MEKTVNQNIMPKTSKINEKGNFEIGGCDCIELAKKYSTPLYVIDEEGIRTIAREYKNAFKDYPKTNMLYASKAFCTKAMFNIMNSEGFGFDLVSGGEIYTAVKSGIDLKKSLFNGNNKSFDELSLAIDNNIGRISVDNFFELALLDTILKSKNKVQDILLRFTPGIECHTHEYIQTGHLDSKFGFDKTQLDEAIELIKDEYTNLNLKGLHCHIGSQIFELKVYYDEVQVIFEEIARIKEKFGIELSEINLGGGLGVTYIDTDKPPCVYELAQTIISSINDASKKYNIELPLIFLEPGRSIVATSGITLYTVGSSKQVPKGRKYVAVDGGMADNPRPSMYQAQYSALIANKANEKCEEIVTIAGCFCESGDILIKDINLPKLEEGDILCVFNTGAYGYSMASNYNRRTKPAMVLVNKGQSDIIIKRETYENLIQNDIIPERLIRE